MIACIVTHSEFKPSCMFTSMEISRPEHVQGVHVSSRQVRQSRA